MRRNGFAKSFDRTIHADYRRAIRRLASWHWHPIVGLRRLRAQAVHPRTILNTMLDHVFISVSDIDRSIDFYTAALAPLGITTRVDYDGKDGPPGHPDLKGFGADGRIFFWLRHGAVDSCAAHVGFVADSVAEVDAAYAAAIAAGATGQRSTVGAGLLRSALLRRQRP